MTFRTSLDRSLIVIEGGDATGKATQSRLLAHRIVSDRHVRSKVFSFPQYESQLGPLILSYLHGESYWADCDGPDVKGGNIVLQTLMMMDRIDASTDIIKLIDDEEMSIVVDRWWQSSVVYGGLDGVNTKWTSRISSQLPFADINILIDLDSKVAMERRPIPRDRYEKSQDFRTKVREAYLTLWKNYMELERLKDEAGEFYGCWVVVDGNGSSEEVHERIWKAVDERMDNTPL